MSQQCDAFIGGSRRVPCPSPAALVTIRHCGACGTTKRKQYCAPCYGWPNEASWCSDCGAYGELALSEAVPLSKVRAS